MNTRVLLYGVVGLVLMLVLSSGGADLDNSPVALNLAQQSAYKNECLKEIIGFEQPARSKIRFCDCVTASFEKKVAENAAFVESYEAFLGRYIELSQSPFRASRALSSNYQQDFRSGHIKLDILLSVKNLRHPFPELVGDSKLLGEVLDETWKIAMIACSQVETPTRR
jgi:hypothetical protein